LHLAADRGHIDVVKLLLSKGVDKSIKASVVFSLATAFSNDIRCTQDPDDMTALELARSVGNEDIISALSE
jgi:ankyrin repeat protein